MIKQTKKEIKTKLLETLETLEMNIDDVCGVYDFRNVDYLIYEAYDLSIIQAEDYAVATKHFYDINETIILDYDIKLRHIEDIESLIDLIERLLNQSQEIANKLKINK